MSKAFVNATKFNHHDWDDERIARGISLLPVSWTTHIYDFKLLRDRIASLLGRWLLFQTLEKNGLSTANEIQLGGKDKPYFEKGPYFNISHSGEWVVVAVHPNQTIGIDVERHRKVPAGIADKYFTPHELAKMVGSETAFFDYWAAKEAVIKADGRGVEILGKTWEIDYGAYQSDGDTWHVQALHLEEGYSCSMATREEMETELNTVPFSEQPH